MPLQNYTGASERDYAGMDGRAYIPSVATPTGSEEIIITIQVSLPPQPCSNSRFLHTVGLQLNAGDFTAVHSEPAKTPLK